MWIHRKPTLVSISSYTDLKQKKKHTHTHKQHNPNNRPNSHITPTPNSGKNNPWCLSIKQKTTIKKNIRRNPVFCMPPVCGGLPLNLYVASSRLYNKKKCVRTSTEGWERHKLLHAACQSSHTRPRKRPTVRFVPNRRVGARDGWGCTYHDRHRRDDRLANRPHGFV